MEMPRHNDQKGSVQKQQFLAPKSLFIFHCQKKLTSATSGLSHSPMTDKTTASLDKLTCTGYEDLGKCQDRFGRFSCCKNDSNYLDVKLKVFKRDDNRDDNGCPKVQDLADEEMWICSSYPFRHKTTLHCAESNAELFGNWILHHLKL